MQSCRRQHTSIAEALYRVFVLPPPRQSVLVRRPNLFHTSSRVQKKSSFEQELLSSLDNHIASSGSAKNFKRPKILTWERRHEAKGQQKVEEDEEEEGEKATANLENYAIRSDYILLVDPETNKMRQEPQDLKKVLDRVDLDTKVLVQVSIDLELNPDGLTNLPICKIFDKAQYAESQKPQAKVTGPAIKTKSLELAWGIEPKDVNHRMEKFLEFAQNGRKIEILFATKKRAKVNPTDEECQALVDQVRKRALDIPGVKETHKPDGQVGVGKRILLTFQGELSEERLKQQEQERQEKEEQRAKKFDPEKAKAQEKKLAAQEKRRRKELAEQERQEQMRNNRFGSRSYARPGPPRSGMSRFG